MVGTSAAAIRCFYLGRIGYTKGLQLQEALVHWNRLKPAEASPVMLLLQHDPVYTVGLRSFNYGKFDEERLKAIGADFVATNRGGLITFHGPGQLVVYPIFNMRNVKLGARNYIHQLEEAVIRLCSIYGLQASRSEHTGVWVGDSKICAMGINMQQKIASHGIAINCNTKLKWFSHIIPCGIPDKGVTSLTYLLHRNISVQQVLPHFLTEFSHVFGWETPSLTQLDSSLSPEEMFQQITEFTTDGVVT